MAGLYGGLSTSAVKTAIDSVFVTEFTKPAGTWMGDVTDPLLWQQKTTDRGAVITEQYQGPGYFEERAEREDLSEGTPRIGNQKTSTVVNYSKVVPISKNLFDDDMHDLVQTMMKDMGRVARITRQKKAFARYSGGFATYTTNDAAYAFSNSHTTLSGLTVDNLETGVLSVANLESGITSLIDQKTQDGTLGGHQPGALLVPTALLKEALEITKSELISNSGNNAINYYSYAYPGLQVRYSQFLGANFGGSDTAWFLTSADHGFCRYERQGIQTWLTPPENSPNLDYNYKAEYREVYDTISWEGLVGSNGTV